MSPSLSPEPVALRTRAWDDYALLDSGGGRKLERYGRFSVVRPEPQCWWAPRLSPAIWENADAVFDPAGDEDEGRWRFRNAPPESFPLQWGKVRFNARFTAFRHLAFFPEQAANWAWLRDAAAPRPGAEPPRILNLFGYTGVASLVMAAAGAHVTHVDASKKAVAWARENAALSGMEDRPVRWIVEDARKYLQREVRRGSRYQGIVLDPPKWGRGPNGELWRLFEDLPEMMALCAELLDQDARFLLLNAYAERISGLSLAHLMRGSLDERGGTIDWGELDLSEDDAKDGREIGLSFFARWRAA